MSAASGPSGAGSRHRASVRPVSARRDEPHLAGAPRLFAGAARSATLRDKMDPRKVNGGVFLGLNGIVIKSHGGTDAEGFAAAIDIGYDMVRTNCWTRSSRSPGAPARDARPTARWPGGAAS